MKRTLVALSLLLLGAGAFAQEVKKTEPPDATSARQFKVRIFEIQNRNPEEIASAIRLLGSGYGVSGLSINTQLHTITVRDFPENIAAMDEAIKRLDKPEAVPPEVELRISVLMASKTAIPDAAPLPEELQPVVRELQSTMRYSHYVLLTSGFARPKPGLDISNEGAIDASSLGLNLKDSAPAWYSYSMRHVDFSKSDGRSAITSEFSFRLRFPYPVEKGEKNTWQDAKIDTPVTVRDGEKVVVGTTAIGSRAVVIVVSAKFATQK